MAWAAGLIKISYLPSTRASPSNPKSSSKYALLGTHIPMLTDQDALGDRDITGFMTPEQTRELQALKFTRHTVSPY